MGLVFDSSIVIVAERRGDKVTQMLKYIVAATANGGCVPVLCPTASKRNAARSKAFSLDSARPRPAVVMVASLAQEESALAW